jgi:septal ring factor EnvC (AmiA/AmiB activator)
MNRVSHALAVLFVALFGVWGCAQGPSAAAQAERIKALEAKINRLETDFRAAAVARDQVRQQLAQAEEHLQRLQIVVKERDELKIQVKLRTSERDQVSTQFESFRKSLKELVGQAEATAMRFTENAPVTVTAGPRSVESGPALTSN